MTTQADTTKPPVYEYSFGEKATLALSCLRQRLRPKQHLIAGPFTGEFGYELMQWQGFVRARRKLYDQAHIITYPGREYLYENCQVHYHAVDLSMGGYKYGLLSPAEQERIASLKAAELGLQNFDTFSPALLCTQYHKRLFWKQDFRLLQEAPVGSFDVAFHFRAVNKIGPDLAKNYLPALADELGERCQGANLKVCCIGHPHYSYLAANCADFRKIELRQTVAAISSVKLVVGENSGPMHLANLCGKPTLIWAQDQWRVDYSLRWNPFQVPIYIAINNTHQPPPALLCAEILKALADLRKRTDDGAKPVYRLPAQEIASY